MPTITVGLASGAIHYDFILPATPEVRGQFAFAEAAGVPVMHPNTKWIVVGWGAHEFYTTVGSYSDVSLSATWKGISGDLSVIRLEALGPLSGEGIQWFQLSEAEFEALLASIDSDLPENPIAVPIASQPYSAFFESPGRFHLFRTCNVWVGEKLRAAGVPFGWWTPTPYAVRLSLWRFGLLAKDQSQTAWRD